MLPPLMSGRNYVQYKHRLKYMPLSSCNAIAAFLHQMKHIRKHVQTNDHLPLLDVALGQLEADLTGS